MGQWVVSESVVGGEWVACVLTFGHLDDACSSLSSLPYSEYALVLS